MMSVLYHPPVGIDQKIDVSTSFPQPRAELNMSDRTRMQRQTDRIRPRRPVSYISTRTPEDPASVSLPASWATLILPPTD